MSGLIEDLTSLSWWMTVVFAGLLVNLAAAYLKPRLDHLSRRRRVRSEVAAEQRRQQIERMRSDPHRQVLTALSEARARSRAIQSFLFGAVFQGLALEASRVGAPRWLSGGTMALGALMLIIAGKYHQDATRIMDLLKDAIAPDQEQDAAEAPEK